MALPHDWLAENRERCLQSGLDVSELTDATEVQGPARLPVAWEGQFARGRLWYAEFGDQRYAVAVVGDPRTEPPTLVRIESACVFGHVFGSEQCDCGWQWRTALRQVYSECGVLLYAIDQDARGLGIAAHFSIYQLRQQEFLDTDEVFRRLDAPWDNRDYAPVIQLLRAVGVSSIRLMSNNRERLETLRSAGFATERVAVEADLTASNMSTLMLEKEDLGYEWSFQTHTDILDPLQASVVDQPDVVAAALAAAGGPITAKATGSWDDIVGAILDKADMTDHGRNMVLYLTDLPRIEDLSAYARIGVRVLVVPYPTLPPLLVDAGEELGIRVVDWARANAWTTERPQWVPVETTSDGQVYRRRSTDFHLDPPDEAATLVRKPRRGGCQARARLGGLATLHRAEILSVDTLNACDPVMYPWRDLCPFRVWDSPVLPVPGMPSLRSRSVEAVWQGLKLVDGATDLDQLLGTPYKRPPEDERGESYAYADTTFRYGDAMLDLADARFLIYLPTYLHLLTHVVPRSLLVQIEGWLAGGGDVVFYDWDANMDIADTSRSFSHSALLAMWFEGRLEPLVSEMYARADRLAVDRPTVEMDASR